MGLFYSNLEVINFAISQNNNIKISTNLTTNFVCSISKNLFFQMYQLAEYIIFIVKSFTETLCDISINQFKTNNSSPFVDFLIDDNKESPIGIDLDAEKNVKIEERLLKIDYVWLEWFIGFSEGDGALCCDKYNTLCFVLTQKEKKTILFHIQSILGFGAVYYDSSA